MTMKKNGCKQMNPRADLENYKKFLEQLEENKLDNMIERQLTILIKKLDELDPRQREILLMQIRLTQMIMEKIRRLGESLDTMYSYEGI